MKKFIGFWLSGFCLLNSFQLFAQSYPEEALIFNRTSPGGSARIQAMGGAQVALGGDYSSAFSNPAGLGFFNRSEVTLSLGTNFYGASSNYLGQSTHSSKANFNVPGFSLVLHSDNQKGKRVGSTFAITYTRTNNFNQNIKYQGINTINSMIDYFLAQCNNANQPPSNLFDPNSSSSYYYTLPWLAYENYLLGPNSELSTNGNPSQYHSYPLDSWPGSIQQVEQIKTSGSQNQLNFAYGVNFDDFFYFGASIGVPTINYQSKKTYIEYFPAPNPLIGYELDQNLHITGTGINATIGGILKPKDFVQFGLSISTPTYYPTLTEDYGATMGSGWDNYQFVDASNLGYNTTLSGAYDSIYYQTPLLYSFSSPWRIKAGATFFIQKHGFITAEVERVSYTNSRFGSNANTPSDFSWDNAQIKTMFHNTFNYRVGGEYRFNDFRVRVGGNYMPDPYSTTQNGVNNAMTSITGGFGYRVKKYFIDLAVVDTQWKSSYLPYSRGAIRYSDDNYSPIVTTKNSNISAVVTVGFNL